MTRLLLGLVLRLYPSGWRERYGAELEQLISDAASERPSAGTSIRLLTDLAWGGLCERFGRSRAAVRVTTMVCLGAVIAVPLDVATVNSAPIENGVPGASATSYVTLSASTRLGPGVMVFRLPRDQFPLTYPPPGAGRRGAQIVALVPSGRVLAVTGAPVNVVLNPNTGTLVSVDLIHRSRAR